MIFRRQKDTKRNLAIGLDLGARQIKAAVLCRQESTLKLTGYAVEASPASMGKANSIEEYATQLGQLMDKLGVEIRRVRATISSSSAIICEAEFPRIPIEEVRSALRLPMNCTRYLRRDLSGFYIDAVELPELTTDPNKQSSTMRVLVGGASKEDVLWYRDALIAAKIHPETIELSAMAVVNAARFCQPTLCEKEMLLLDIGARTTTINFIRRGMPIMTRIMQFGGEQISEFVGQILTVSPKVAEEEKIKMSEAVQPLVRQAILPLAREIRSSIDFFERQQECHLTQAFACGGSACSSRLLDVLGEEVGFRILPWNSVEGLETAHFNGEGPKLTSLAPSLTAAIGVAVAQIPQVAP